MRELEFVTTDISNFWNAYDSIQSTADTLKQSRMIKELYFGKATEGLSYLIANKKLTVQNIQYSIAAYPDFWISIRSQTMMVNNFKDSFAKIQKRLFSIYPYNLNPCKVYFLIGDLKTGGIMNGKDILIGTEVAASNSKTNLTELNADRRERMQLNKNLLFILTHEYIHKQQNQDFSDSTINVLSFSLREGIANFITSLITNDVPPSSYMKYGFDHELEIWNSFEKEMYSQDLRIWVGATGHPDFKMQYLGYFVGYVISKSYYDNAIDKKKAVKEIIDLNYSNKKQISEFLAHSLYSEKWNSL